jgi:endonuclease-3
MPGKSSRKKARITSVDYGKSLQTLIVRYRGKKHPLDFRNRYELVVAVLLAAQDSDAHINKVTPAFFEAFPSMKELAAATAEQLHPYLSSVKNFRNKSRWLAALASSVGSDEDIPSTMEGLTALSGLGRKSSNVIIRESGGPAEGIIVDLHVVRVAPRIGVAISDKPEKIEKELMAALPREQWGEVGMAMSFLGREICRPSKPKCGECPVSAVCTFYNRGRTVKKRVRISSRR